MGKVRDSIDEVIGESNPVGFPAMTAPVAVVRRIFAIIDRFSC